MSKDQSKVFDLDAGNLLPVAMNIRELSSDSKVIIAGDNDPLTKEYQEDISKTKARGSEQGIVVTAKNQPGNIGNFGNVFSIADRND